MSDWVTDPRALRTLIALDGIQAGDEVRQQFLPSEAMMANWAQMGFKTANVGEVRVDLVSSSLIKPLLEYYADETRPWKLIGWRRP